VSDLPAPRTPVSVVIGGEEYKLRSDATPEYTRDCAAYVDRTLSDLLEQAHLIEGHKAAILAALSITDQLFQARGELEMLRSEVARLSAKLAAEIQGVVGQEDLASGA